MSILVSKAPKTLTDFHGPKFFLSLQPSRPFHIVQCTVHSLFKTSPYISPDFTISKLGSSCTYGLEGKLRVCVQVCCNLPLILHLQEPKYRALFFSRYSVFSSFSATVGWSDFNFFYFRKWAHCC